MNDPSTTTGTTTSTIDTPEGNGPLTVAVLGTGIMGSAMARNILRAGHHVRAWNRTMSRAEPLAEDGATVTTTPAQAVTGADVVLTMLFDADAVREVMREAAPGLTRGVPWLQSSTVGLEDTAEFAGLAEDLGLVLYEAPVSGTRGPAETGKLIVLAAGPTGGRKAVQPVLDAVGSRTMWTGQDPAAGSASRLKLVVNSWVITLANAAGETTALAESLGVDPQQFLDLIDGGVLDQAFLRIKAGLIRDDELEPANFTVAASRKDSHLIVDAARARGLHLDGAEAFRDRLDRAAELGRADQDMVATYYAGLPQDGLPAEDDGR
jgi:3-hydroxyisobutyrate dehydrogenase